MPKWHKEREGVVYVEYNSMDSGRERGGEMKKVTTARIKEKLLGEIVLGVDWQQEIGQDTMTTSQSTPVEQLAEQVRAERDALISAIRWRIERHRDEVDMSLTPTEPIGPLLTYIQALRDVPQQAGFPHDITWPQLNNEHTGGDAV